MVITPSSPTSSDTLSAAVSTSDADGDEVTVTYQWNVNGGVVTGLTGASVDPSDLSSFDAPFDVSVTVTPDDGTTNGESVTSAPVTVTNSAPTVDSVAISPDPWTSSDTLTAEVSTSDVDGDQVIQLRGKAVP